MSAYRIRLAEPEDWPGITEVFVNAGRAAWPHIVSQEALGQLAPSDRWLQIVIHPRERTRAFVACVDDKVKGFIILRPSEDEDATTETGEVDSFYTDPSIWGMGVGQELMAEGIFFLKEAGFQTATLWTEARNHRPRTFYDKNGWTLDGAVKRRALRGLELEEVRYRKSFVDAANAQSPSQS